MVHGLITQINSWVANRSAEITTKPEPADIPFRDGKGLGKQPVLNAIPVFVIFHEYGHYF